VRKDFVMGHGRIPRSVSFPDLEVSAVVCSHELNRLQTVKKKDG
jgi:hypothetical protein